MIIYLVCKLIWLLFFNQMVAAVTVIVVLLKNVMKISVRIHVNQENVASMLSAKPSTTQPYAGVHLITQAILRFYVGKVRFQFYFGEIIFTKNTALVTLMSLHINSYYFFWNINVIISFQYKSNVTWILIVDLERSVLVLVVLVSLLL